MNIIDLHVHSLVSDDGFIHHDPSLHAKEVGLSAFALTDHDNIAGNEEAAAAAKEQGLDFINGMELTADFMGRKLHIVCLGFDAEHPSFQKLYERIRSVKEGKIPEIIDYVRAKGIDISLAKVQPFAFGKLDRYAIMRYLVSLHLYDRAQPLWDNYLDPAVRELGLDQNMSAEEALPAIHEAGGVTSLAHFHKNIGLMGLSRAEQEEAIARLHALGSTAWAVSNFGGGQRLCRPYDREVRPARDGRHGLPRQQPPADRDGPRHRGQHGHPL